MPSNEELLNRLEERFARGEVSEHTYDELKASLLSRDATRPETSRRGPEASSAWPTDPEIPPNTVLSRRFSLREKLGVGGFGAVYLAEDQRRSQLVALKVISCDLQQAQFVALQLRQGLHAQESITDYRHIIRTHDIHTTEYEGRPLILLSMEYAPHGSLRFWLDQNRHDRDRRHTEGVKYFVEACRGVQAIHDASLAHLDLKPENLLLSVGNSGQPMVKVSDLGMARSLECLCQDPASQRRMESSPPTYRSPSQFLAASQKDVRYGSDIYSLGVILFEILDDSMKEGSPAEFIGRRIHGGSPKENPLRRRTQPCCLLESTSTNAI